MGARSKRGMRPTCNDNLDGRRAAPADGTAAVERRRQPPLGSLNDEEGALEARLQSYQQRRQHGRTASIVVGTIATTSLAPKRVDLAASMAAPAAVAAARHLDKTGRRPDGSGGRRGSAAGLPGALPRRNSIGLERASASFTPGRTASLRPGGFKSFKPQRRGSQPSPGGRMERRGSLQGSGKSLGSGGGLWEAPAVSNRLSRDESYDDDMYDHHEANELHERGHSMSAVEAGEAYLRGGCRLMAADPMWRSLYPLTEFGALCAAARDGELLHRLVLRR